MPRPKKNADTAATLGYEAQLWQMADALRGSMDASEYKHVVLGLLFLKYISDAFEEKHAALLAEKDQGADPEDPDEYRAQSIFWVPPEARWAHLKAQARQSTIGQLVFDATAGGQALKCLTVVDEFTAECLAIDVAGSIRSARVIEVLARLISERGAPAYLRSDNGPEFVSAAILRWLSEAGVFTAHIDRGKPWQNGTNESFNGKFRNEYLSLEWFRSRAEARVAIEAWRRHYNEVRPHSRPGYLTPVAFPQQHLSVSNPEVVLK